MNKNKDSFGMKALLQSMHGLEKALQELQDALQPGKRPAAMPVEEEPTKLPLKENPAAMADMIHRMAINPSLITGDKQKHVK